MKKALLAVAAVLVICLAASANCSADTAEGRAIRAAKMAAEAQGIMVGEAELIYDPSNKKWEERVAAIEQLPADPNHGILPGGILNNFKYETVLLDFKEGAKSADTWVFLNKGTGDVILLYQEKR